MEPAFAARGVTKRFGRITALEDVDIEVRPGELFGLLGPNGAGKTTLVKIGCGLVRPSGGTVAVGGRDPRSVAARKDIGYLAELFRFPGWLTASELLDLHQHLAGSEGGAGERQGLLSLAGLTGAADRRIETMSKGMQQRLGIAQALVGSPRLLLLDEPTSALDPGGRRSVRTLLERLRADGVSVLLNSHLLSEVELVCDRVAIIDRGRVVAEGTPEMLTRRSGIEVETADGTKRFPDVERADVPALIARLVSEGERIYAVRPLRRSLEQAYLDTVSAGEEA